MNPLPLPWLLASLTQDKVRWSLSVSFSVRSISPFLLVHGRKAKVNPFLPSSLGTAAEPIHCCFLGCCTCFCSWVGNESSLTPAGPFNRMFWLTRIHSRIGWCKKKGVRGRSGDRLSRFSFFFIEALICPHFLGVNRTSKKDRKRGKRRVSGGCLSNSSWYSSFLSSLPFWGWWLCNFIYKDKVRPHVTAFACRWTRRHGYLSLSWHECGKNTVRVLGQWFSWGASLLTYLLLTSSPLPSFPRTQFPSASGIAVWLTASESILNLRAIRIQSNTLGESGNSQVHRWDEEKNGMWMPGGRGGSVVSTI